MRYRQAHSRSNYIKSRSSVKSILVGLAFGVMVVDGLAVSIVQAKPDVGVAMSNAVNYESNALGVRPNVKIYTNLTNKSLSDAQRQNVTFKDNSYVSSMNDVTKHLGDTSGLFLQGYVAVPNLNISEPIYYGTSNTVLANGVGSAKDGQVMGRGNYGISGHNMGRYVNWKIPVPDVSGGYINPGSYFTALQDGTPTDIYLTDGSKIYQYKEASRYTTNLGNGHVLDDSFPHDDNTYTYPKMNTADQKLGSYNTVKGLNLKDSHPVDEQVGEYKGSALTKDASDDTLYTVKYKTNYAYASSLSPEDFKITIESDGVKIPDAKVSIVKTHFENGELAVSFKMAGDVSIVASTIGSKVILHQLQDTAYVTLTTCIIMPNGAASNDRMVNTGTLVKVTPFDKAPKTVQALFPAVVKNGAQTITDGSKVTTLEPVKLTMFQKIAKFVVSSIVAQSEWLSNVLK